MKYLLPPDENERLQELYSYEILDTAPEKDFDELVELASQICECPIAAISFIDKERQWFKAKKGDATPETSRDISFCTHAILGEDPLIVEDATKDERFAHNPDVRGGLNIGFYAGVPINSFQKKKLGTVCVIDRKARQANPSQIAALKLISLQVSSLLELRLQKKMLLDYSMAAWKNSDSAFEVFFNQSETPKWIYDLESLQFLQVNDASLNKYGYEREKFLQMKVTDITQKKK